MTHFDLQLLATLVAIAETGSISAAAPRRYRSQSAVSEQVRKLEEVCGQPLLIRGKTGARLTPAGERLVVHARKLLAFSDFVYRDMQGAQLAGRLRLAITDYFRPTALPELLKLLRDQFPRLHLSVAILKSARIEEEVDNDLYDIGLSMNILHGMRPSGLRHDGRIRLRREPLRWIAAESFFASDDTNLQLVMLPETCSLQRFITKSLNEHGVRYTVAHSASGIGGLHLALSAGLGMACLNTSAIPDGMKTPPGAKTLPNLPDVEFSLLPPRQGEPMFIAEARNILVEHLR